MTPTKPQPQLPQGDILALASRLITEGWPPILAFAEARDRICLQCDLRNAQPEKD